MISSLEQGLNKLQRIWYFAAVESAQAASKHSAAVQVQRNDPAKITRHLTATTAYKIMICDLYCVKKISL